MDHVEIRRLSKTDDRSQFDCGDPAIDRFFQYYAGQNQFRLHLAVTWVGVRGPDVVGYATVAGGSLEREHVPSSALRRRLPAYPLPVLRLARLGVDRNAQGLGIGAALVRQVLMQALAQCDEVGCVGVVTDAKQGAAAFYQALGFTPLAEVREGLLHGEPVPMFLGIAAIATAVEAG